MPTKTVSPLQMPPLEGRRISFCTLPAEDMPAALAIDVADRLSAAIQSRGRAVLHVSGGQSPIPVFRALSDQPLQWHKVQVSLADERCVPLGHPDSNATLVRTHLMQGRAASARFLPLVNEATEPLPEPTVLAQQADQALRSQGPADVLILGMGADGHTASIFAEMSDLAQALDLQSQRVCLPVMQAELPENIRHDRITQTLAHLLSARHIVLQIGGSDKLQTLQRACADRRGRWPIASVLHQSQAPVAVWISS